MCHLITVFRTFSCLVFEQLAGPAGCGKTQFCYQLALQATLPKELGGKDGHVLYIDTEQVTSASRWALTSGLLLVEAISYNVGITV